MCGICGFNFADKDLIKKMSDCIEHRGPDAEGFFIDKYVSLANRRLSIIDLSKAGNQPIFNEDKTISIVYNGEIFNFMEIRHELEKKGHRFYTNTDTEVIVHAYEEYGENCLNLLNGFFAFCIYDSRDKKLFLARDRMGIKPLYYFFNEKERILMFASEIKAILVNKDIKRSVNIGAFNRFISLSYNFGEQTLFNGIRKLSPGCYINFDLRKKQFRINKYWNISCSVVKEDKNFFINKLRNLLFDSVRKRLISDRPVGVYLSGGIDSSSVVAIIDKLNKQHGHSSKINTFSVGFSHEEDELEEAQYVADHFSTNHKPFILREEIVKLLPEIVWHSDEPIGDPALIPINLLSKNAKKSVTVILTGDGADEIFAGYEQYKFLTSLYKLRHIPHFIRKGMSSSVKIAPYSLLNLFFKYSKAIGEEGKKRVADIVANIADKPKSYLEFVSIFNEEEKKDILSRDIKIKIKRELADELRSCFCNKNDYLNQLLLLETKTLLVEDFLMKNDKMTMAHSIEARLPYLDYRIVELAFKMPPGLKLHNLKEKYILRKTMQKYLPKKTYQRKKQRFYVPMDLWLKDMKWFFDDLGKNGSGYFKQEAIEKIYQNYGKSRLFYGRQLWNILTFELWHKIYIGQCNLKDLFN